MTELYEVLCLINVIFQFQQPFVAIFDPFCHWSCQSVDWPWEICSSNACRIQGISEPSEHILQRGLQLFHSLPQVSGDRPCKALPLAGEKIHLFCFFAESFNAFFGMTFHIVAPSSDLFQRMCFFRLVFFRQPPLSSSIAWTSRFRNELPVDQPLPLFACNLNTLDPSLALDIRGRFLSAELSTWVHCVAPFQPFLYHPHTPMRKIRASCARKDTLQVCTLLPSFSDITSSNFLTQTRPASGWPHKFLSRSTTGVFNIIPTCWYLSWRNSDPHFRTFFFRHS